MFLVNVKRIIKTGFVSFWRNTFVSLASVLVMIVTLFVIGILIFTGALLDASLLAEVYLAMSRGQESLIVETDSPPAVAGGSATFDASQLVVLRATADELAEHEKILLAIDGESKGKTLWRLAAA